jgi:hypothetical protein
VNEDAHVGPVPGQRSRRELSRLWARPLPPPGFRAIELLDHLIRIRSVVCLPLLGRRPARRRPPLSDVRGVTERDRVPPRGLLERYGPAGRFMIRIGAIRDSSPGSSSAWSPSMPARRGGHPRRPGRCRRGPADAGGAPRLGPRSTRSDRCPGKCGPTASSTRHR